MGLGRGREPRCAVFQDRSEVINSREGSARKPLRSRVSLERSHPGPWERREEQRAPGLRPLPSAPWGTGSCCQAPILVWPSFGVGTGVRKPGAGQAGWDPGWLAAPPWPPPGLGRGLCRAAGSTGRGVWPTHRRQAPSRPCVSSVFLHPPLSLSSSSVNGVLHVLPQRAFDNNRRNNLCGMIGGPFPPGLRGVWGRVRADSAWRAAGESPCGRACSAPCEWPAGLPHCAN